MPRHLRSGASFDAFIAAKVELCCVRKLRRVESSSRRDLDRGSGNEKNSLRSEATPEIGEATLSSSRASK